ncbi:MAG: hypothetical protein KGJ57_09240 [Sphingomonadales bacterium]|nr:hypothetical protein [Sphingomonadales bacterium]MDE2169594.1 hypothetical protein [Sphingomonadales bacterium]
MAKPVKYIPNQEAAYIDLLLRDLDAGSRKAGLQRLCAHHRAGSLLMNPVPYRTFILGLLNDESDKVRRWALNALALFGTSREATPILRAIEDFRSSPDTLGAAISALSVLMSPEDFNRALKSRDLPLEGSTLFAAAQQNPKFIPLLKRGGINIDKAAPIDLRMATILVGLNKAPYRIFSPRHTNAAMIGQLNNHDDRIVAQYSVWATVESPVLGLTHLKLPLRDTEAQPENVRGWIYRLIASDPGTAAKHSDILQTGSTDASTNARFGLAEGLVRTAFPGVDDIAVNWFLKESNDSVRQILLEHMAQFSNQFPRYGQVVEGIYRSADHNSLTRARLEAAAQGTKLYGTLKTIDLNAEMADLFPLAPPSIDPIRPLENVAMPKSDPPPPDPNNVLVLIVVAIAKELAAIKALMTNYQVIGVHKDPNVYGVGYLNDPAGKLAPRAVLVCQSQMGNNNAATTATDAMRSFPKIEHVIMCGIAGGCPNPADPAEHVRLGDIVYSSDAGIIEYDFVKEDAEERKTRSTPQKPSARMLGVVGGIMANEMLGERPWQSEIKVITAKASAFARPSEETDVLHDAAGKVIVHPAGTERDGIPRVHGGAIGTADTLQKNPGTRDKLRDDFRVKAIEMEAGGVQNSAWAHDRSVMIVRGICDYCDPQKNDIWQMYAAAVAAAFTKVLIMEMPSEWFPAT